MDQVAAMVVVVTGVDEVAWVESEVATAEPVAWAVHLATREAVLVVPEAMKVALVALAVAREASVAWDEVAAEAADAARVTAEEEMVVAKVGRVGRVERVAVRVASVAMEVMAAASVAWEGLVVAMEAVEAAKAVASVVKATWEAAAAIPCRSGRLRGRSAMEKYTAPSVDCKEGQEVAVVPVVAPVVEDEVVETACSACTDRRSDKRWAQSHMLCPS